MTDVVEIDREKIEELWKLAYAYTSVAEDAGSEVFVDETRDFLEDVRDDTGITPYDTEE